MTMEIAQVQKQLKILAEKLTEDKDIHSKLKQLLEDIDVLYKNYSSALTEEGEAVLLNKESLIAISEVTMVQTESLKPPMKQFLKGLTGIRDGLLVLQANFQSTIEECRKLEEKKTSEIREKTVKVSLVRSKIINCENEIRNKECEATSEENVATTYKNAALQKADQARRHRKFGVVASGLSVGVGLIFAPVTGGLSLAVGSAAAIGNFGRKFYLASDCDGAAKKCTDEEVRKRKSATYIRSKTNEIRKEIKKMESEIEELERQKAELMDSKDTLREVARNLCRASKVMDDKLAHLQDLEATVFEADKFCNEFKLMQSALQRYPKKYSGKAQECLDKLKTKWIAVENELLLHSRGGVIQW